MTETILAWSFLRLDSSIFKSWSLTQSLLEKWMRLFHVPHATSFPPDFPRHFRIVKTVCPLNLHQFIQGSRPDLSETQYGLKRFKIALSKLSDSISFNQRLTIRNVINRQEVSSPDYKPISIQDLGKE